MILLQGTMSLAVVVTLAAAWDPWAFFDGTESAGAVFTAGEAGGESLCPSLYSLMEDLATNNTFNCQPLPSSVDGKIPEFCNFAAVDTVRGCKGRGDVSACLAEALEVSYSI